MQSGSSGRNPADLRCAISPDTNHKFTGFSDDFLRLSVAFAIEQNNNTLAELNQFTSNVCPPSVKHLLHQMLSEYKGQQFGYTNAVTLYIQAALIEVLRAHPDLLYRDGNKPDTSQKPFHDALSFIRNNISFAITTEDVAKGVNLSSRQLNRIFNENINMSISEFIKNERILRVQEHLKKTNLSLREIAVLAGFNDEYILCKTFKKITGISPGKYRSTHKKSLL